MMILGGVVCFLASANLEGNYLEGFSPHAWLDFFIDAGDFTRLPGEREK